MDGNNCLQPVVLLIADSVLLQCDWPCEQHRLKKSRMAFFTRTVFGVDRIRTTSVNLEVKGVARCHFPRRMI